MHYYPQLQFNASKGLIYQLKTFAFCKIAINSDNRLIHLSLVIYCYPTANTAPAVVAGHATQLIQLGVREVSNTSANHQHHYNILPG